MQRALIAAFIANIGLNPLFMFGLPGVWSGMGFNGIAAATIISQTGVMVYILVRIFQLDNQPLRERSVEEGRIHRCLDVRQGTQREVLVGTLEVVRIFPLWEVLQIQLRSRQTMQCNPHLLCFRFR